MLVSWYQYNPSDFVAADHDVYQVLSTTVDCQNAPAVPRPAQYDPLRSVLQQSLKDWSVSMAVL